MKLICLICVVLCHLPSPMNHRSFVYRYCLRPASSTSSSSLPVCLPLRPFVLPLVTVFSFFSTHYLPCFFALSSPPPTICPLYLLSFSLPNNILSSLSLSSFFSSAHLPPRGNLYFWPVVCICHVRAFAISWSSGDSSRSLCLKSCYGQTRGTGHGGAACWRQ